MEEIEAVNRVPEQTSPQEKDLSANQDENGSERLSVSCTGIGEVLTSLDPTIIATAIPRITDEFHSLGDVAWYGSAFFLVNASFQTAWVKAYGFFSLKITYLIAIFVFEIGSLICAVAPSSVALTIGRAIAGLGAAGVNTGSFTLAAFSAPPRRRPIFTGLICLSYGVASVVGPLLGGVFTEKVTWRWCFYINLPVGALSACIIIFFFQNPPASKSSDNTNLAFKLKSMNPVGTGLLLACVTCYSLAMQYGGMTHPWNSSVIIGLLVGFVLILTTLAGWELYMDETVMCAPRLVKRHALPSAVGFFFFGSYISLIYYLPIYFQSINGKSAIESAVDNLPFMQSGAAAAFNNQLLLYLPKTAPEVDPSAVVAVGATELESFGSSLHGVRTAYINGLKVAFALSCTSMGVACILSVFSRRKEIGGKAAKSAMGAA